MRRAIGGAVLPAALLVSVLATPSALAQTQTFCTEPVTPYCATSSTVFDDAAATKRCRGEVNRYVERMAEFVACLDDLQQEARARAAEIEEHFECTARGDTDCP